MSLVEAAIEAAGLGAIARARRTGKIAPGIASALEGADLLALGALADEIRAREVGDCVRVLASLPVPGDPARVVRFKGAPSATSGLLFLRHVAIARITGDVAVPIRIDWMECGEGLGQVALGFGASEILVAPLHDRALPMAGEAGKKDELVRLLCRTGRSALFIENEGAS